MTRFIPALHPSGYKLGWISPELIVRVDTNGRYFQFKDKDRISDGVLDSDAPEDAVLVACGIKSPESTKNKIIRALMREKA